jgi:hypothetical protein
METIKLTIAFFLCLGLAIYLAIVLGKAINIARRGKTNPCPPFLKRKIKGES